jgi:putative MATE family efflux protein
MRNSIAQQFNVGGLVRFTLPTVVMMIISSLYGTVDGIFIARFVGTDALAASNIVFPALGFVFGAGIMFGAGGSAVVGKDLGAQRKMSACRNFTRILLFSLLSGVALSVALLFFMKPLLTAMGASERLLPYCEEYLRFLAPFLPLLVLQIVFGMFFVAAGRPGVGMWLTVVSGLMNMALDYLLIVSFGMGMSGAALATAAGFSVTPVFALFYFRKTRTELYFVRHKFNMKAIAASCTNGSSEMVGSLASSVVGWMMNVAMMRAAGEEGVAALTAVLYTQFLFTAVYYGYSSGVAPVISYNHGSRNTRMLRRVFGICAVVVALCSLAMTGATLLLARPLTEIFLEQGTEAYTLAIRGYRFFSLGYLFAGFNIFVSGFFTALSNGRVSAWLSFARTFGFSVAGVLLLPAIWHIDGLWISLPVAEAAALPLSLYSLFKNRWRYRYF